MSDTPPPTKLLWVDLEMTGLDPATDLILEVAALVTDWDFTELASYEATIAHEPKLVEKLIDANPFWAEQPKARAELMANIAKGTPELDVQQELLALFNKQFDANPIVLAGNSIHQDRRFIRRYWPMIDARLHYRMLDVSAWKIVLEGKYGLKFPKDKAHRAIDDIRESIDELKFYLDKAHF